MVIWPVFDPSLSLLDPLFDPFRPGCHGSIYIRILVLLDLIRSVLGPRLSLGGKIDEGERKDWPYVARKMKVATR